MYDYRKTYVESISQIFDSINASVKSIQILDCYCLGQFKVQQSRPRPILVKLQRTIDANAILANRSSISSSFLIKPGMSPVECANEPILLKEHWSLIQTGYNSKQIKLSSTCIYIDGQIYGEILTQILNAMIITNPAHHNQWTTKVHCCNQQQNTGSLPNNSNLLNFVPSENKVISIPNTKNLKIKKSMKLAIINCRSIVNKCTELEALLHVQNLDLLIGTESYLDKTILSSEIFPSQYTT